MSYAAGQASDSFQPRAVRLLKLFRPQVNLGLHVLGPGAQLLAQFLLLASKLFQSYELGDVFDPMNDVPQLANRPEYGRINRAPKPFFKCPAFGLRASNV